MAREGERVRKHPLATSGVEAEDPAAAVGGRVAIEGAGGVGVVIEVAGGVEVVVGAQAVHHDYCRPQGCYRPCQSLRSPRVQARTRARAQTQTRDSQPS